MANLSGEVDFGGRPEGWKLQDMRDNMIRTAGIFFAAMLATAAPCSGQTEFIQGDFDRWRIARITDPITDAVRVELLTDSLEPPECSPRPATFVVACRDDDLVLALMTPCTLAADTRTPFTIRFGDLPPSELTGRTVHDGRTIGLATGARAQSFISGIRLYHRLVIRFSDRAGRQQTVVFNTRMFGAAATAGSMSCNHRGLD